MAKNTKDTRIDIMASISAYRDEAGRAKTRADKLGELYFYSDSGGNVVVALEFDSQKFNPVTAQCHHETNLAMFQAKVQKRPPDRSKLTAGIMGRDESGKGARMLARDLIAKLQAVVADFEAARGSSPVTPDSGTEDEVPF